MTVQTSDPSFESLLMHLKEHRGFDFTGYKRASLMRRVQRRMNAVGAATFDDYQDFLQVHPDEFTALFNTILINVTGFFRDTDSWAYLRDEVLPALLERRQGRPVRMWSAGCATGEEAYSLAILFAERLGIEEFRERVKIYATDVDEDALALARQAAYSQRDIGGVPEELREIYFDHVQDRYLFRKELRRSVIFGRNDLVQDAPISQVDLLACRNTLMYFNAETQAHIVNRLHFALRPDGILFLGKAEMLLSHSTLFNPIDLKRRLFRKNAVDRGLERRLAPAANIGAAPQPDGDLRRLRDHALLSTPTAQVVIDAEGRLAASNNRADAVFGLSSRDLGKPFRDLGLSYRPAELRQYIDEATEERRTSLVREVEWTTTRGAQQQYFDIQVIPLLDDQGVVLGTTIVFTDVTRHRQLQTDLEYANRQLETAYEELQSTNEELETTNEELQSTVEELETTNEELQSTNEELETMNEELQSMNDELQSANTLLQDRQSEISKLNQFMRSILASMRSGIAVVDNDMRVTAWNHRAEDLWGIRSEEAVTQHFLALDIGLPVDEIAPLLRRQFSHQDGDHEYVELKAVNRRGRRVDVRVTVSPLDSGRGDVAGAIVVMDLPE